MYISHPGRKTNPMTKKKKKKKKKKKNIPQSTANETRLLCHEAQMLLGAIYFVCGLTDGSVFAPA